MNKKARPVFDSDTLPVTTGRGFIIVWGGKNSADPKMVLASVMERVKKNAVAEQCLVDAIVALSNQIKT